ncbi:MAG: 30S ribosomal protein S4 [bacterium]
MITGPKYKIARRLGAPIFEKTQTAKFKARAERDFSSKKKRGGPRSDYGKQLIEKQKARFTYGISEKQFSNYVNKVIESKSTTPTVKIFEALETRLDNVVYRLGLVPTRRFARQAVSHGHILVNGRRLTIPSFIVKVGDTVSIREGSKNNGIFAKIDEVVKKETPVWLTWNSDKQTASMLKMPSIEGQDLLFDLGTVIEFYKK